MIDLTTCFPISAIENKLLVTQIYLTIEQTELSFKMDNCFITNLRNIPCFIVQHVSLYVRSFMLESMQRDNFFQMQYTQNTLTLLTEASFNPHFHMSWPCMLFLHRYYNRWGYNLRPPGLPWYSYRLEVIWMLASQVKQVSCGTILLQYYPAYWQNQ